MLRNVLSLAALALLGCTEFEPGTDELPEDGTLGMERSSALTPEAGRDWSCIGDLSDSSSGLAIPTANAARLVQSLQVLSLALGNVPPNLMVRACAQQDVGCLNPVSPVVPVDAQGYADLPLYEGFDGYLEITGPGMVPTLMFYQDPLSSNSRRDTTAVGLVESAVLPMLTAAIGTPQDEMSGLLALRAFDCANNPAPRVRYSIDRTGVVPWYFVSGLPSGSAAETDRSGLGGFLNVSSGITVVQTELTGGEREIALPKSVLSRPGWLTVLRLIPSLRATSTPVQ